MHVSSEATVLCYTIYHVYRQLIYICMYVMSCILSLFNFSHTPCHFFLMFFLMRPFKTQVQFFFSDGPCLLCCLGGKCFFIWIDLLSDCRLVVNKVCDIVIESKGKDCGPSTLSAEGSPSTNLFTTFMILHIFWMLLICLWTLCLYGCFIRLRHIWRWITPVETSA